MSAYLASYLAIALSIRLLAGYLTVIEIGLLRSVGSLAIAGSAVWAGSAEQRRAILPSKLREDVARSVLHLAGSLALIWSLAHLPLVLVTTIEFTGPLFAAVLLFLALRRRPGTGAMVGLAVLATGIVLLVFRLDAVPNRDLAIAIAAVAVLTTTNLMLARLAAQRSTLSIVLMMHAIQLPLYLLLWFFIPEQWSPPPQPYRLAFALPELAVIGGAVLALIVGGFVSQAALANASRHASPLQLCSADTLRVPLITLAAYLLLAELPPVELLLPGLWVLCGVVIISLPVAAGAKLRPEQAGRA
jgi:drug/metabolite transporter (DMT)-like permease